MGKAGLEACAGFLVEGAGACPLVGRAGCCPLCLGSCPEVAVGSLVFRQPVC